MPVGVDGNLSAGNMSISFRGLEQTEVVGVISNLLDPQGGKSISAGTCFVWHHLNRKARDHQYLIYCTYFDANVVWTVGFSWISFAACEHVAWLD